jgi:hypothetical protein
VGFGDQFPTKGVQFLTIDHSLRSVEEMCFKIFLLM